LTTTYGLIWEEDISPTFKRGAPTSVVIFTTTTVNRLNIGAPLAKGPLLPTDFWDFLNMWGGMWTWEGINKNQPTKHELTWLVEGMKSNTLIWVMDGLSIGRRQQIYAGSVG
jgi:hypothetical protein